MPQVQTYLKESTFRALERKAKARGIKLSELMREMLEAQVEAMPSKRLLALAGSWEGELERPPQGKLEEREGF
ncbi:MAG: ribbon-helix-helix protein, CopG family [Truepera sp.]|nr:ribbon-helix-helix protein, CopG family [Truepera sp.]